MINDEEVYDINDINDYYKPTIPCNRCVSKFIRCELCQGFFKVDFYHDKHRPLCVTLYEFNREQEEMLECPECGCLIELKDYLNHTEICANEVNVDCTICYKPFRLQLIEEHEKTCLKTQEDMMLIGNKIDCSYCGEYIPLVNIEEHEKVCKEFQDNQKRLQEDMNKGNIDYPEDWDNSKQEFLVKVDENSSEYTDIITRMTLTAKNAQIINLWRIQNKQLYEKYFREKLKIKQEKGFIEENILFYGNKHIKDDHIYKVGFDISYANDNQEYGRGIYFEKRADKAIKNVEVEKGNKKTVFVCKVLTGIPYVSAIKQSYRKPPFYDESRFIYHDSITNIENFSNLKECDQIFVIYNNEKAYPSYLIEFKELY
jgi:hypothetical protein